jgi:hypothetical protein
VKVAFSLGDEVGTTDAGSGGLNKTVILRAIVPFIKRLVAFSIASPFV